MPSTIVVLADLKQMPVSLSSEEVELLKEADFSKRLAEAGRQLLSDVLPSSPYEQLIWKALISQSTNLLITTRSVLLCNTSERKASASAAPTDPIAACGGSVPSTRGSRS